MPTQADLDALKAAYYKGHLRVRYADKDLTYRSGEEMRAAIAALEAELAGEAGTLRRKIHMTDSPRSKGWGT